MLKVNFFKSAEFFDESNLLPEQAVEIARYCNAKLATEIEKWPVVYQDEGAEFWGPGPTVGDKPMRARLFNIEEIPKECKHEPDYTQYAIDQKYNLGGQVVCRHCGVELVAEWKAK